jgi:hypothetical protein
MICAIADLKSRSFLFFCLLIDIGIFLACLNMGTILLLLTLWQRKLSHCQDR